MLPDLNKMIMMIDDCNMCLVTNGDNTAVYNTLFTNDYV